MIGTAYVLKYNIKMDSAILKVNANSPFYSTFGVRKHKINEELHAAGFPATSFILKAYDVTIYDGKIINTKLLDNNFILMSVPVVSGMSGGPVLGSKGLIRGQTMGGYDTDALIKNYYGKDGVKTVFKENATLNLMISSIKLKKWIDDSNIVNIKSSRTSKKLDSEEIGEIAERVVGHIGCYYN